MSHLMARICLLACGHKSEDPDRTYSECQTITLPGQASLSIVIHWGDLWR